MGIFDAIAGLFGASEAADAQHDAIKQATKAQTEQFNLALGEQRRQYDTSRADQMPWLKTGGSALEQLAGLYGLNGQQQSFDAFKASPDYNFRMSEGIRGVDAGAAARGMLDSGATRKAEIGYAGNLASSEFGNYAQRLMGLAGIGQNTAQSLGALGQNSANTISGLYTNQGENLASSYLAQGQNTANRIGTQWGLGGQLAQDAFSAIMGSVGGVPGGGGGSFSNIFSKLGG